MSTQVKILDQPMEMAYIVSHENCTVFDWIRTFPRLLGKASRQSGRSRSEVAREALRRQLRLAQFETVRRRLMPFAEARGFLTDEDVFGRVS